MVLRIIIAGNEDFGYEQFLYLTRHLGGVNLKV